MKNSRPFSLWVLVTLLLILAISGILGGYAFASDPSGKTMGMGDVLPSLPFPDFLLTGLFLLIVMGIIPFALAYFLLAQRRWLIAESLTRWSKHYWAWTGTVVLGIVLIVFLVLETIYIGFYIPLQYVTGVLSLGIFFIALLPDVEKIYRI